MADTQNFFYQQLKEAGLTYDEPLSDIEVPQNILDLITPTIASDFKVIPVAKDDLGRILLVTYNEEILKNPEEVSSFFNDFSYELLTFVRNVDGTPEAQAALSDNLASKEAKKKLAVALGGPAVTAEGVLLLERIGSESRGHHAARLADEFVEIIVTRQNRYIAKVTSAVALSQAQLERLSRTLNKIYNRQLKLDVSIDTAVLGGMRVQIGDEVIDGTVGTRLDDLERDLQA